MPNGRPVDWRWSLTEFLCLVFYGYFETVDDIRLLFHKDETTYFGVVTLSSSQGAVLSGRYVNRAMDQFINYNHETNLGSGKPAACSFSMSSSPTRWSLTVPV